MLPVKKELKTAAASKGADKKGRGLERGTKGEGRGEGLTGKQSNYIYKLPIDRPCGCYW